MPKAIFSRQVKLCPFQKRAIVLAIFLPGMITFAQVGPGVGALQNILEQQLNRDALQPQTQPATKAREEQAAEGEKNIEVSRFELRGNQLFSQATLDEVMRPWTGRALSFDELMSVFAETAVFRGGLGLDAPRIGRILLFQGACCALGFLVRWLLTGVYK